MKSKPRLAGVAAICALTLSSCGGLHPGAAATVGEEQISMDQVDGLVSDFCEEYASVLKGSGQQSLLPRSKVRREAVGALVTRTVADQIATEYDVNAGASYESAVQQAKSQLPESYADSFIEVALARNYVNGVVGEAARAKLAEDGVAQPTKEQIQSESQKLYSGYFRQHEVDVDPRFGVRGTAKGLAETNPATSYGVSDFAVRSSEQEKAQQSDPSWVMSLPKDQRCGWAPGT